MDFTFQLPTRVMFGYGKTASIGEIISEMSCRSVFVVTDEGVHKAGLLDKAMAALKESGISAAIYTDIEPDPSVETVDRAAAAFLSGSYDCIVAVGGGSPIDAAKGVRVVATNGGSISQYNGVNLVKKVPEIPLIVVPTTAGTGSEVTIFGVYSDWVSQVKITVTSPHMSPTVSIVDPELTMNSPKRITAASGIDALAHAVEALFSKGSMRASDGLAKEAIHLIQGSLRKAYHDNEREARIDMSHGSLLAGMAFSHSYLGLTHAISSSLSGHCHVPHGVAIGLLLPPVAAFNAVTNKEKALVIASLMNVPGTTEEERIAGLAPAIAKLVSDIELPFRLRDVGVRREQLEDIARDTFKSRMLHFNPRQPSEQEVLELITGIY